jgi:two-component system phosphate regulon sensor histidine kinase PhoR
LKKAILQRFLLVLLIALLICCGISCLIISNTFYKNTIQQMLYSLKLIDYSLDYSGDLQAQTEVLNPITMTNDTRITILDFDGNVCADSSVYDTEHLENHLDRTEIEEALQKGYGSSHRNSSTLDTQMLYVSYRSEKSDYIIRLAIPFGGVWEYISLVLPGLLVSCIAAFFISLFFASRFAKTITEPLDEISNELLKIEDNRQDFRFSEYQYDELNQIVITTAKLSDRIQKTMDKLRLERNKIDYILCNMTEGFLLLDEQQNVLTINYSARKILDCPMVEQGLHLTRYTQKAPLLEAADKANNDNRSLSFDLKLGNGIYAVHVTTIQKLVFSDSYSGIAILLVDVTSDRSAQQMRQEFFSNVSHELKTPITSIQGFAELLESDMVTDEATKKEFLSRIKKETRSMTNLIDDILMISKLESKQHEVAFAPLRIKLLIEDIISSLSSVAQLQGISMTLDCEDITYYANAQQIHQLVNNLMSNAVKYNRENGRVQVTVKQEANNLLIAVADTGIGIPKASQGRIFERFYRVDKGRSKKMGGTGLGLSIVKHIVQFYNGSISLESQVNVGTTITVRLPIKEAQA